MKTAARINKKVLREQFQLEDEMQTTSEEGYKYIAADSNGVLTRGVMPDEKYDFAFNRLKRAGMQIEQLTPRKTNFVSRYMNNRSSRPSDIQMAQLAEKLGTMLEVLPSPGQAAAHLSKTTRQKVLKDALQSAAGRLYQGDLVSTAFEVQTDGKGRPLFPPSFIYALRIGQEIGATPDPESPYGKSVGTYYLLLRFFSEQMKKRHATIKEIRGMLYYPVGVSVITFIAFLVETYIIVPTTAPLYQGLLQSKEYVLPLPTRMMLSMGTYFNSMAGYLTIIGFFAALAGTIFWLVKTPSGIDWRERKLLRLPYFGNFYRDYNASQVTMTMAMVWEGKDDIKEKLGIVRDTTLHPEYREMFSHILRELTVSSQPLPELFAIYDHLMGEEFASTIETAEISGLGQRLFYSYSKMLEQRANESMKQLMGLINPVSMAIVLFVVVFILLASYLPGVEIIGNLSNVR